MANDWAWLNGRFLPAGELLLPVTDAGFLLGVTVAEQLRTFRGKLFRLENHLERLEHSLAIVGIEPPFPLRELAAAAQDLAGHNHALLAPEDDLGLTIFVTPGTYGIYLAPSEKSQPVVAMHTYPLGFRNFAAKYEAGDALVVTDVRQVPDNCWPTDLKVRSRVHYYLADQQARKLEPGARAVLLDQDGHVTESTTANLLIVKSGEIISPPREAILPGVSLATVEELARSRSLPFKYRVVLPLDLEEADEILLCSTSPCLWPVLRFNGAAVGSGQPGPVFRQLISAWSELVGFDIAGQAKRFSERSS
jgi:branched-subunit amino acid aminotransferase/4-amino-4-deoxychorismate lyase